MSVCKRGCLSNEESGRARKLDEWLCLLARARARIAYMRRDERRLSKAFPVSGFFLLKMTPAAAGASVPLHPALLSG